MAKAKADMPDDRIFKLPLFHYAPIVLTSCHGMYELDDLETTEKTAFVVPENTIIFETSTIGDYTMTPIDFPLWQLCQGKNRLTFLQYLTGRFGGLKLEQLKPEFAAVIRAMRMYVPGQKIYNRLLSIGGGRMADGASSARLVFANMGFYKFNVDDAEEAKFPDGPPSQILRGFRTELIEDENRQSTYGEIIDKARGEEGVGPAIFIFSCCAEARKMYSNTTAREFNASLKAIEERQQAQQQWFHSISPMGLGGPGYGPLNVRERMLAEEVAKGAGGGAGAKGAGNVSRKASLRLPAVFAESLKNENERPFAQLADPKILERILIEEAPAAPVQPAHTKQIFYEIGGASGGAKGGAGEGGQIAVGLSFKQLYSLDGDPWITAREFRRVKREFPDGAFYELVDGEFVPLVPPAGNFAGGRRRSATRKHRKTRRNLKSRR